MDAPKIIKVVANHFKMLPEQVISPMREKEIIKAKHIAMYFCKQLTNLSLLRIGNYFNGKDHATVLYAIHSVENQKSIYKDYKKKIDEIMGAITGLDIWEKYKHYETDNT